MEWSQCYGRDTCVIRVQIKEALFLGVESFDQDSVERTQKVLFRDSVESVKQMHHLLSDVQRDGGQLGWTFQYVLALMVLDVVKLFHALHCIWECPEASKSFPGIDH